MEEEKKKEERKMDTCKTEQMWKKKKKKSRCQKMKKGEKVKKTVESKGEKSDMKQRERRGRRHQGQGEGAVTLLAGQIFDVGLCKVHFPSTPPLPSSCKSTPEASLHLVMEMRGQGRLPLSVS